ncbi:MAG: hypothetical protein IKJ55_06525 [Clostridia bacterium]|nr:hypothetical protein [Clostridia bacterium]
MKKLLSLVLIIAFLFSAIAPMRVAAEQKLFTDFEAFDLVVGRQGGQGETLRFVVRKENIPFDVADKNLLGLKVAGSVKIDEKDVAFNSKITAVEIADSTVTFSVAQTNEVPRAAYDKTAFSLKVYPELYIEEVVNDEPIAQEMPRPAASRPETEIAVSFNGEWMQFDVNPVIINGRTMVPMRAIFEALGCTVHWMDEAQTAVGIRNGKTVFCTINSMDAMVDGVATVIDQPAVLLNNRTMVPLRFISEAFGCTVEWEESTQSVYIQSEQVPAIYYVVHDDFETLGTWTIKTDDKYLQGISVAENEGKEFKDYKPAIAKIRVQKSGKYKLWVHARDYAKSKPGTRFFNVAIDGEVAKSTFGKHGTEGFAWEDGGVVELSEGVHTISLLDTSGFYARCKGILLTDDLSFVVPEEEELEKIVKPFSVADEKSWTLYPQYTKEIFEAHKTVSIENNNNKVVFYQGNSSKGALVQYEIFTKNPSTGEWICTRKRNEESGVLLKYADTASFISGKEGGVAVSATVNADGVDISNNTTNFYEWGQSEWFFPYDFEVVTENKIKLFYVDGNRATLTQTFEFDGLTDDLKVTSDAIFKTDGAYSFAFYANDGVTKSQYDTVTAPILYNKHAVPDSPVVLPEAYMYTPMNTLYFTADNNVKTPGIALTQGLAVDPESTVQDFNHPDSALYGTTFYAPNNKVRPQLVAPVMGTENANFKAGECYTFSYRVLNRFEYWYDTLKHVAVDMYNCKDIRTNYYGSVNNLIYNTTDLMMDDAYGGWDKEFMGHYNMEGQNFVSHANIMSAYQRYLMTEDEALLETRVVPTIAYALSRDTVHYAPTNENDGLTLNYAKNAPTPLTNETIAAYGASVFGGLYEMSQGRMPYLLDFALNRKKPNSVFDAGAFYKYTGDEAYKQEIIKQADNFIASYPNAPENRDTYMLSTFVYGDYLKMVSVTLAAYELTGEQKYLDIAEEAGRLLMCVVWTTGYQNDFAQNTYRVEQSKVAERPLNVDVTGHSFFWHGKHKWRLGNVDGEAKPAKQLIAEGKKSIPSETVPGWLPAVTGMGAEHPSTPGNGVAITMNNWLGAMVRLSEYTGDRFFETQARNAIIGRYQNYPGYYVSRYMTHHMHENYPYEGPDFTSVYWHHIPVYLSMVEDFLINEAWAKSNRNIDFPALYQKGYAYFYSYQFGQAPGKFYTEDDVWLWLKEGVVEPDNINIDYITARKDGVLCIALMNEDNAEVRTTVKLGKEVGENINTTAVLLDADGNASEISVVNSQFTANVPSKGIKSVIIKGVDSVKKPAFAKEYVYSTQIGQTVSAHTNGYGYVIQPTADKYWAYIYITDMHEADAVATLTYTVDGKTQALTDTTQGYEWLVKVENPDSEFTYTVDVIKGDGTKVSYGGGTLKALESTDVEEKVTVGKSSVPVVGTTVTTPAINKLVFKPFDFKYSTQGSSGTKFRFVCRLDSFPFEVTENSLTGLKLSGTFIDGDKKIPFEGYVLGNEMRNNNATVVIISETADVKASDYKTDTDRNHVFDLQMLPQQQ